MISLDKFEYIKCKYCYCSSWAVWAEQGDSPKSNIGDLSVLDPKINTNLLSELNPNIVLVGLNISSLSGGSVEPFSNFHSSSPRHMDYKIRYATQNTPLWGAYMTDIIKNFPERVSVKVSKYLRDNREVETENVSFFRNELHDIGAINPTLIAFGNDTFSILKRNLQTDYKILTVPHYAHYISKEKYREQVAEVCHSVMGGGGAGLC